MIFLLVSQFLQPFNNLLDGVNFELFCAAGGGFVPFANVIGVKQIAGSLKERHCAGAIFRIVECQSEGFNAAGNEKPSFGFFVLAD